MTLVEEYASRVMAEIHDDMTSPLSDGKLIPRCVGSFTALHDWCDAGEYLINLGIDTGCAEADNALTNAVADQVDRQLATEAAAIHAAGPCGLGEE